MFSLTKKFELSADADESVMCQTLPIQFCSLLEMMYYLLTGSGLEGGGLDTPDKMVIWPDLLPSI